MAHVSYRDLIPTAPAETQVALLRRLRGKNVLVTGGTSGIGQAIAIRFLKRQRSRGLGSSLRRVSGQETRRRRYAWLVVLRQHFGTVRKRERGRARRTAGGGGLECGRRLGERDRC